MGLKYTENLEVENKGIIGYGKDELLGIDKTMFAEIVDYYKQDYICLRYNTSFEYFNEWRKQIWG